MKIALFAALSLWISTSSFAQSEPAPTHKVLHVRTQLVDSHIVAVTANGEFYSIVCSYGTVPVVSNSTAVMLLPNKEKYIVSAAYNKIIKNTPDRKSASIPLTISATVQLCNYPNGEYVLNIMQQGDYSEVQYLSHGTLNAHTGEKGRGF